jgi:hypothetical protein
MTNEEAMKLALEAMKTVYWHGGGSCWIVDAEKLEDAERVLEEALAKQEQGVDWKDMYEKEKRRSAMWIAKYEKDIGPLEYAVPAKQEQGEPFVHGGGPMTLRECMEAEEPQQEHSFTYEQMKEHAEGMQRDYDLLLAEYNLLKQEQGSTTCDKPVACVQDLDEVKRKHLVYELGFDWKDPLYTTPQQRKPLTEEQLIDLWPSLIMHQHTYAFARAIEAAHGIKE